MGKCELTLQDCNQALRQNRTFIEASLLRAGANACLGKYADALKEINHCISIHPRTDAYARALSDRARIRATCRDPAFRDGKAAVKDAMSACKLMQWKDEITIEVLAMAYAEAGDFDSAVRYAEQALTTKGVSPEHSKRIQRHIDLFKQHKPLRLRNRIGLDGADSSSASFRCLSILQTCDAHRFTPACCD